MTGVNWSDPRTFWLNLTNLALGLTTLAAVLGAAATVIADLIGTSAPQDRRDMKTAAQRPNASHLG
ncbi:MAG: hypothetical protein ABSF98_04575 [Bryobacteraceae bacterium]|jgi:hypothetical protein